MFSVNPAFKGHGAVPAAVYVSIRDVRECDCYVLPTSQFLLPLMIQFSAKLQLYMRLCAMPCEQSAAEELL
jgi:hypothetical protein